ncbi:MAG: hypothetical protein AB7I41_18015 [Candidatus Sericytochromatia bacterium]
MKIFPVVLVLIFGGMIGLYLVLGRLGGGEQLQQDKALAAEIEAKEALIQKRPDLALVYFDKGLKALKEVPNSPMLIRFHSGRGEALAQLKRCPEAQKAWAAACKLGDQVACKATCQK